MRSRQNDAGATLRCGLRRLVPALAIAMAATHGTNGGSSLPLPGGGGGASAPATACGSHWTWVNPFPTGYALLAVASTGSGIVAVGSLGAVLTSPDGVAWEERASGTFETLYGLAWTGARLIAVGGHGTVLTSPDGISWTPRASGTSARLWAVLWNGAQAVAVGDGGTILTSPDGAVWAARASGTTADVTAATWTGTEILAVGSGGTVLESADGTTWRARTTGFNNVSFSSITWTGNLLVAAGRVFGPYSSAQMILFTSPDGSHWTPTTIPASAVTWTGGRALATGGGLYTSPDGLNWTYHDSPWGGNQIAAVWTGAQFVVVGSIGEILTSPDADTWVLRTRCASTADGQNLSAVASSGTGLVAVGMAYAPGGLATLVFTSPDGRAWTWRPTSTCGWLWSVAWTGTQFVAVGSGCYDWKPGGYGLILTSPDGVTWTPQSSGTAETLSSVVWTGSQLVASGTNGTVLTSPDGTTWTPHPVDGFYIRDMVWTGRQLVGVGMSGPAGLPAILTSADAMAWTDRTPPNLGMNSLYALAWTGSRLVAVGYGTVLTSPDGVNWTTQVSGSGLVLQSVAWTGAELVAAGYSETGATSAIVTSTDGSDWIGADPSADGSQWEGVVRTGADVLAVGNNGAVMRSDCPSPCSVPAITVQPNVQPGAAPGTVSLSVGASASTTVSYQWYRGAAGDTSHPIWLEPAGSATSSHEVQVRDAGTEYWVRVATPCGSVDSESVAVGPRKLVRRHLTRS